MSLVDALFEAQPAPGAVLRDGIVTSISPLTITVPPSTVASPAAVLNSVHLAVGDFVQVLVQGANRLVIGATNGRAGVTSYTRKTADSAGIGTTIANVIQPAAVVMVAGRRYKFDAELVTTGTVAGDVFIIGLGSITAGLYYKRWFWQVPTSGFTDAMYEYVTESSFSGSHSWTLDVGRIIGSGTATIGGNTTTPNSVMNSAPTFSWLKIEDIGPL